MKKKNLVVAILSLVAFSFAADAPNMVQSIVRAAVGQTGNTLVESTERSRDKCLHSHQLLIWTGRECL